MVYITKFQNPQYHQLSIEELLFGEADIHSVIKSNLGNTYTQRHDTTPDRERNAFDVENAIRLLEYYITKYKDLYDAKREELYSTFYIPKKSGGLRRIDAPNDELKAALKEYAEVLKSNFGAKHHTAAFAYVEHRNPLEAVKRHQANESRWFFKSDFSNFFGNTTLDFTMSMLNMIYPFNLIMESRLGQEVLRKFFDLGFLNGGLPQGTPLSPMLTNLIMIPIDHELLNSFRDFNGGHYIYTRYADDILISNRYDFKPKEIENYIRTVLAQFGAPYEIKPQKTRYGSSSGSNWNLGLMLNKDNKITVGYKNIKRFKCMIFNYMTDAVKGVAWSYEDMQQLNGIYSYYKSVEGESLDEIIKHESDTVLAKTGVRIDPISHLRAALGAM